MNFQLIEHSPDSFRLFNELQELMQTTVTHYLLRGYYLNFQHAPLAVSIEMSITRPDRLLTARSSVPKTRQFQARPHLALNFFRWAYVVCTSSGLAFGTIYCQHGDDLTDGEINELRSNPHIELREVASRDGTAGHV